MQLMNKIRLDSVKKIRPVWIIIQLQNVGSVNTQDFYSVEKLPS